MDSYGLVFRDYVGFQLFESRFLAALRRRQYFDRPIGRAWNSQPGVELSNARRWVSEDYPDRRR